MGAASTIGFVANTAIALGGEATLTSISAATTALAIEGAMDSFKGAQQSTLLKKEAIQQGLWSQVTKQADAQAGRAAKSADSWNQM
ncbi:hypothetical protein [Actimicrobium antarcticum]|uniref:Uncharacterized protein n=1 Tax=Actimicrobium antarcticum TaxID=1051899 RepID=A0ABP7SNL8_9BURK